MRTPRGLTADEAALWRRVAETVTPLHPARPVGSAAPAPAPEPTAPAPPAPNQATRKIKGRVPPLRPQPVPVAVPVRPLTASGLDGTWDRKLTRGTVEPDVTIDLHGMTLAMAHDRLNGGVAQALAMGARVILLIAGKHRPVPEHDLRGERRGAIRAKLLDWLAAGPHASRIAAVRAATPRHGGDGAVYIVLRKAR
jgi:DNA-nicking Smr family endonuclease